MERIKHSTLDRLTFSTVLSTEERQKRLQVIKDKLREATLYDKWESEMEESYYEAYGEDW